MFSATCEDELNWHMLNAHDNTKEYFIEKAFFVMLAVDILQLKMNYLSTRRNFRNFKAQQKYLIATFVKKMLHIKNKT